MAYWTVSEPLVDPVWLIVNLPGFAPVSAATESVTVIVTTGSVVSLSAIVTVALDGEPTL